VSYAGPIAIGAIIVMTIIATFPHKFRWWHTFRRQDTIGDVFVTLEHGFLAGAVCGALAVYWAMS
jgi:hypothetical protein